MKIGIKLFGPRTKMTAIAACLDIKKAVDNLAFIAQKSMVLCNGTEISFTRDLLSLTAQLKSKVTEKMSFDGKQDWTPNSVLSKRK